MHRLTRALIIGLAVGGLVGVAIASPGAEDLAELEAEVSNGDVLTCENVKARAGGILEARYLGLTREEQMDDNNHLFMKMIAVEAYELPVFDGQANRDVQIDAFASKWQEKCLSNPEVTK